MLKKIIFVTIVAILAYYGSTGLIHIFKKNPPIITDFITCEKAGRPIMESYPRQCLGINEKTYVEIIDNNALNTDPVILSPDLSRPLTNPVTISGEARGFWFFEATFPVKLVDDKGNLIATGTAKAKGDWMTADFVPFTVTINFKNPATKTGELILIKDNPSGLASQDQEIRLPVFFQKMNEVGNKIQTSSSTEKKPANNASTTN
ncbi:MAG: hypothetical protein A2556_01960 [Candidatus Vogelbacteria bacterium RIFOXYD2_FULL_44_9]|uniref:Bacterial spore germination immunoglobulin-like domain-containing protein n=1 Tax=Candidatus Vogelbacteria bacterium RIFOXYD2_FULL_44_9 TaxID=1802441 RepID=A0A1G2QKE0_9BACT|nr:MAG: hypothetical protein A2556_01960 [Candidatus Vogelbacteria bacterium RIFOXYD2_FULL_44_9]